MQNTAVSIPNGMEFYVEFKSFESVVDLSFNSQRDGILRLSGLEPPPGLVCFNSQRDGILRLIPLL